MDAKCCPANSRWLDEMLMFAQREDVVTVGPKIYYRDRSVAYAGIALSKKKKVVYIGFASIIRLMKSDMKECFVMQGILRRAQLHV